jgi:putative ABC transport system permease protein
MSLLRAIAGGLRSLFRKEQVSQELDEELNDFLEMAADEKMKQGMSRKDALRAVRLERGNLEVAKEVVRTAGWESVLETCWQDLRFGLRTLHKNPGFSAVAVLTLALGIGASTSAFSIINAVLIRSLPYRDPQRLVYLWSPNPKFHLPIEYFTPMNADFFDLQKQNHSFATLSLFGVSRFNVVADARADALGGAHVSGEFFDTIGVTPELGRAVVPTDDQPGQESVAVISHRVWQSRFGSSTDILGKTLLLDAKPYRIIGVMPAGFGFPHATDVMDAAKVTDIWIPWAMSPEQKANRSDSAGNAIGRLRPGVSVEQARAEMSQLMARIDLLRPASDRGFGAQVMPFVDSVTGGPRHALLVLIGAAGLLLLIACSNVASLALVRASSRIREMGVRTALGAGRARLIRQLLTESLSLAIGGGTLGIGLAFATTRILLRLDPGNIPRLDETSVDLRVLLFASSVSILTGLLFGLFPALSASRCDPSEILTQSGSKSVKGEQSRFRQGLITAQVALTVVLLIGSGLFIRSLMKVDSVPKGFDPHSTVTMSLSLDARYEQPERQRLFYRSVINALSALPGVQAAGAITNLPLAHGETLSWLTVEGHNFDDKAFFQTRWATPRYFAAMGIGLLNGRFFTDDDTVGRQLVAIVNRTFAREYFPRQNALGKRFHFRDGAPQPTWWTIVGVVDDIRHASLEEEPQPQAYLPFWQSSYSTASVVLRTIYSSEMIVADVRGIVNTLDSSLAIGDIRTMDQLVSESTAQRRFQTLLLTVFSAIALILSLVGLYALVAYSVRQRTAEIGIRVALGAQRRDILRLVIRQGTALTFVGVPTGILGSWTLSRFFASLLFEVKPTDGTTFAVVAFLVCCVALAACYIPARRAVDVDPLVALRYE